MTTVRVIVNEATRRLRQTSGTHVQQYTEPQLVDIVNGIFVSIFERYNFSLYHRFSAFNLTGIDGYLLEDMSSFIKQPNDIIRIMDDNDVTIDKTKFVVNPLRLVGTRPLAYSYDSNPQRLLQFYPLEATGIVYIHYKARPVLPFDLEDDIPLPKDLFVSGACADYLKSDGANPDDANKFVAMFDTQLKTLLGNEAAAGVPSSAQNILWTDKCFTIS